MTEPYTIISHWTGMPQVIAKIDCDRATSELTKLGLAVQWAVKNGANLRAVDLRGANLDGANLRAVDLRGANLDGANLRWADLCGANLCKANLRWADLCGANLHAANLCEADLDGANLCKANLRWADLCGANLHAANLCEADLSRADLRGASLCGADLDGANMSGADLQDVSLKEASLHGADLQSGIPIVPNIDAAILTAINTPGNALDMDTWHTCKTTHCRAGWAIKLAGDAGRDLEEKFGPAAAGALIYAVSRPDKPIPDFYATKQDTLTDLRMCAKEQRNDR